MKTQTCIHPYPEDYGTSQVHWIDRREGIGQVHVPCGVCGDYVVWSVTA